MDLFAWVVNYLRVFQLQAHRCGRHGVCWSNLVLPCYNKEFEDCPHPLVSRVSKDTSKFVQKRGEDDEFKCKEKWGRK